MEAGGGGVRKFEVNNLIFDELRIGDIVEIEHSLHLRFIYRLRLKGHQEFSNVI